MAPQQPSDEWDDDDMVVLSAHAPLSQDCDCELGEAQIELMTPMKELPLSILRRRLGSRQQEGPSSSPLPSHWPTASAAATMMRQRVHFADGPGRIMSSSPPSVVTAIYYRPRTPIADVSSLYYSALDVKNFKREFRALLRSQKIARQRLQQNSDERMSSTDTNRGTTTVQHRDNSFWRSKVSRWSAQTSAAATQESNQDITEYDDIIDSVSPPDPQLGGIFSSVFDVAREAVSLFGASSSYYQKDKAPQQIQHHHLVDTLYLF
jgi:hypothetical protein